MFILFFLFFSFFQIINDSGKRPWTSTPVGLVRYSRSVVQTRPAAIYLTGKKYKRHFDFTCEWIQLPMIFRMRTLNRGPYCVRTHIYQAQTIKTPTTLCDTVWVPATYRYVQSIHFPEDIYRWTIKNCHIRSLRTQKTKTKSSIGKIDCKWRRKNKTWSRVKQIQQKQLQEYHRKNQRNVWNKYSNESN